MRPPFLSPLRSLLLQVLPFRPTAVAVAALAVLPLTLAGCGGGGGSGGSSGSDALLRVTVEPSDEAQTFSAGDVVTVTVPGGLLSEAQTLEVRRVDGPGYVPMPGARTGGVIEISLGDEETFGEELELEFPVDLSGMDPDVPATVQVQVAYWDDVIGAWVFEPAEVDVDAGVARVRTHHLSWWAWFASFNYACLMSGEAGFENFNVCFDVEFNPVFRDDTILSIHSFAEAVGGYLEHASEQYEAAGFERPDFYPLTVILYEGALTDEGERKEAPYYSPLGGKIYFSMKHFNSLDEVRQDSAHELFHAFENQDITAWSMAHRFWFTEAMAEAAANRVAWGFDDTEQLTPLGSGFFSVPLSSEQPPHPYEAGHFIDYLIGEVGVDAKGLWDSVADEWAIPVDAALQFSLQFIKVQWELALGRMSDYLEEQTGDPLGAHWGNFAIQTFFSDPPVFADLNPDLPYFIMAADERQRISAETTHAEQSFVLEEGFVAKFWTVYAQPDEGETSREVQVVSVGGIPERIRVFLYLVRDGDNFTEGSQELVGVLESGEPSPEVALGQGDYLVAVLISEGGEKADDEPPLVLAVSDVLRGDLGEDLVEVPAGGSVTLDPGITGGTPPYTYAWTVDGSAAGTGATLTLDHRDLPDQVWVEVQVADANGLTWSDGTTVRPEDVETQVSFPDHSGRWTVTLTFPEGQGTGYRFVPESDLPDDVYGWGELVEIQLGAYPSDPAYWYPSGVSVELSFSGEPVSSWRLYPASNTWDPASRNTSTYWDPTTDPPYLRGDRYYWLYIYPESGSYSMEIIQLVGTASE